MRLGECYLRRDVVPAVLDRVRESTKHSNIQWYNSIDFLLCFWTSSRPMHLVQSVERVFHNYSSLFILFDCIISPHISLKHACTPISLPPTY